VVEGLTSTLEVLGSILKATKKKKKTQNSDFQQEGHMAILVLTSSSCRPLKLTPHKTAPKASYAKVKKPLLNPFVTWRMRKQV
jgi:hypothetical protein